MVISIPNDEVGPVVKTLHSQRRSRGLMDKAPDYQSGIPGSIPGGSCIFVSFLVLHTLYIAELLLFLQL